MKKTCPEIREVLTMLYTLLNTKSGEMTGVIEIDKNNGTFHTIRNLVTAIHILERELNTSPQTIKIEYGMETWSLLINHQDYNLQ